MDKQASAKASGATSNGFYLLKIKLKLNMDKQIRVQWMQDLVSQFSQLHRRRRNQK